MTSLTVRFFPLCALLISVFGCIWPQPLAALSALIVPLLGVIMLGMGTTLSPSDFITAAKHPKAVLTGMLLQFLLMPLLAWLTAHLLYLPKEQFIGVIMVGTVAGGTASNVIAYLAGGDVALSITMTACSTLGGIVLTPLITSVYLGETVHVPVWAMFQSILLVVALPVSLGLLINRVCRKHSKLLEKICPIVSSAGIVLVIGIIVALNAGNLRSCGPLVFLAVVIHNVSGLAAGYFFARLLRFDQKIAITIAIEVGMQNSGLASALSKQFFGIASALPGAIFSIWHNLSGALFAAAARRQLKSEQH
jgi:BASS family bile acid:Na+ symporter